jgi:hypothetical protein
MDGNGDNVERPGRIYLALVLAVCAIAVARTERGANADDGLPSALSSSTPAPVQPKPLPPRDCWRCPGPAACGPCRPHHPGFLYYETWPWDDDPVNGFNDCPGGDCGWVGTHLTLGWIHLHQWLPNPLRLHCRQPGDTASYQHNY